MAARVEQAGCSGRHLVEGYRAKPGAAPMVWPRPRQVDEFQRRYRDELEKNPSVVEELKRQIQQADTTLLYAAKDVDHNHAIVLQRFLSKD
jgi:uncharacterized protein YeaO (DUF488 family)